jgi:hypothetical protein
MKRFLLFHGFDFYPLGGMEDFKQDSNRVEELISYIDKLEYYEWAHIYEVEKEKIVLKSKCIDLPDGEYKFEWEKVE